MTIRRRGILAAARFEVVAKPDNRQSSDRSGRHQKSPIALAAKLLDAIQYPLPVWRLIPASIFLLALGLLLEHDVVLERVGKLSPLVLELQFEMGVAVAKVSDLLFA